MNGQEHRSPRPKCTPQTWRRLTLLPLLTLLSLPTSAADLVVSAAASLTNAFKDVGSAFEQAHPDTKVVFNFAASGPLLQQIVQGAPVDVFASADEESMDRAQEKRLIADGTRADFAANTLVLIVPAGAARMPARIADLTGGAWRRIAIGNPASVPVGRYASEIIAASGMTATLAPKLIHADSVRQVLAYVARGEVDAGFVYLTDAAIDRDKVKVAFSAPTRTPIRYPVARIAASGNAAAADRFIAFVRSPAGQQILARHGFSKP